MQKKNNIPNTEKTANQSSDKLLQILECISQNRLPVRLQDLSAQVNMSQSTVLRYLNALQNANYVYQDDETSRYALTWKICKLSENVQSALSLRNITGPFINQITSTLAFGVCLVIEQNHECVYLDCIDASASFDYTLQRIGKRAPMHATGSGKILLTQYAESQIDDLIADKGLTKYTDNTITTKERLLQELAHIKSCGYATDNEECEIGLQCISSPIYDYSRKIIAALSIFGSSRDLTSDRIEKEVLPILKKTTTTISFRLGYENRSI